MQFGSRKIVFLLPVLAAFACGGGGGGDAGVVDPSPTAIIANFRADEPTPGTNTEALLQGAQNADVVTVKVTFTNISGIYGSAFEVLYDTSKAAFVGSSPGTLLEQGSHIPTYQIGHDEQNGRIVVAASRNGNVGTANAAGTVTMLNLTFRAKSVGESQLTFESNPILYDGQDPPQPKPGITWSAGTLVGSQ